MVVSEVQLFQILKLRLGEKEAETLVEFIDYKVKETNEINLKVLATKEDIKDLEVKIADSKVEILKWMVTLIIGLFIAMVGSMAAIIKLMMH